MMASYEEAIAQIAERRVPTWPTGEPVAFQPIVPGGGARVLLERRR